MEILSDATFRGATTFKKDVTISGADLFVTRDDNTSLFYVVRNSLESDTQSEIVHIGGNVHISGRVIASDDLQIGGSLVFEDKFGVFSPKIMVGSKNIYIPRSSGTLALTSDITSMTGITRVQRLPINFDVAADCTLFYVMDADTMEPYSLQMFKYSTSKNGEPAIYLKNVDLGVVCGTFSGHGSFAVVVEKSSSFAISASDNYEIRMVYMKQ